MKSGRIRGFDPAPISSPGERAGSHIVLLIIWIVCFGFAQSAHAEVRIFGEADALKVEARNATVDEVLRALQGSYKFRFQSSRTLSNPVSGTYTGPLPRIVTRLLEGYDYVMRRSAGDVQVSIISADQPVAQRQQRQIEPPKDCKYDDGFRVIPVEC
jgi:hypothetical protein